MTRVFAVASTAETGELFEYMLFQPALGPEDAARVRGYLMHKWGQAWAEGEVEIREA